MTSFKPSSQLRTKLPNVSSISLELSGASDPGEARFWAQKFNLGGPQNPRWKKYAHPRTLSFKANSNAVVSQVVFGPPAFGSSAPLAVVSGPRVCLYGTTNQSAFGRALYRSVDEITPVVQDRQVGTGGHPALCGSFRNDGRLIVVGTDNGQVRVCDATSRATLATFESNMLPIRSVHWLRNGKKILAGGDDGVVRLWTLQDAASGDAKPTKLLEGHGDAVRCTQVWQPRNHDTYNDIAISGSYDHTIRIWNLEANQKPCLGVLDHGAPVEALLLMPNPSGDSPWLLSAGGTEIKVWNFLAGRCHKTIKTQHSKTITSLVTMTRKAGESKIVRRILTAALDGLIRIHTWDEQTGEMKFVHGLKMADSITSVAFNETSTRVAIGTSTGVVSVRQIGPSVIQKKRERDPRGGTYSFFVRGMNAKAKADDFVVKEKSKKRKLQKFDIALKQFRYGDALDEVLKTKNAQLTMAVLEELGRRRGIVTALSNRDETTLEPVLAFLIKNITRPQFTFSLVGVANRVCDIYGKVMGYSPMIDEMFSRLKNQVHAECMVQRNLLRVVGQIDALAAVQKQEQEE